MRRVRASAPAAFQRNEGDEGQEWKELYYDGGVDDDGADAADGEIDDDGDGDGNDDNDGEDDDGDGGGGDV
eukprot:9128939-Pyramimonas_sp.AAC.1